MSDFATVDDITKRWRTMSAPEQERAKHLIPTVSARIRYEAEMVGKDFDSMLMDDPYLLEVARQITVDIVARTLMTSTNSEPMSQMSQSALGYSVSGTYLIPGGGLFIKDKELKALGLKRQRFGTIDLNGVTTNGD